MMLINFPLSKIWIYDNGLNKTQNAFFFSAANGLNWIRYGNLLS